MDAITLILDALETGNAPDVGAHTMVPEEFRDEYATFTDELAACLQKVGGERLLEEYMGQPELWGDTLAEALEQAGADQDEALIDAAQRFMSLMDVRKAARGGYTVDFDEDEEDFD